jgi:DNA-binding transcriptional regulator LsrR (DeoR family)
MSKPTDHETAGSSAAATDMQFVLDPVLTAAWLYYEEGLKQDEVAHRFGISRASVFNLLQKARDEGVVTVSIDLDRMNLVRLAADLKAIGGIDECYVVPSSGADRPVSERIAGLGARLLERRIGPESVLGVAWGRTVMALSEALTQLRRPNTTIAQITGSAIATYDFSPELCTSNIALKLGGRCVNLHAPGIVSTAEMKALLMGEPIIAQHFRLLRTCDVTLFGVTDLGSETLLKHSGFMTTQILRDYEDRGAVGFVSGYFYDRDGHTVRTELDDRHISMSVEDFLAVPTRICVGGGPTNTVRTELDDRHISMSVEDFLAVPTRICVGGGPTKVEAIRAMLKGGYANVLVTDEATARAVLAGGV